MDKVNLRCKTAIVIPEDVENIADAVYEEIAGVAGYTEDVDVDILRVFYTGLGNIEVQVFIDVVLTAPRSAIDPADDILGWVKASDAYNERAWADIVEEAYYLACDIL